MIKNISFCSLLEPNSNLTNSYISYIFSKDFFFFYKMLAKSGGLRLELFAKNTTRDMLQDKNAGIY